MPRAAILMFCTLLASPSAMAQPAGLNYTSQTSGWIELGHAELSGPECSRVTKDFTFAVQESAKLDPSIKLGPISGFEAVVDQSLGQSLFSGKSLANDTLTVTLDVRGDGNEQTINGHKVCVGGADAFLALTVRAFYRWSSSAITTTVTTATPIAIVSTFQAPDPDLRIALDMRPVQRALAAHQWLKYGDTIRLGEFGCGDPQFSVQLNNPPLFTAAGFLRPDGQYGTTLAAYATAQAEIHGGCFGSNNKADATAKAVTTLGKVSSAQTIHIGGTTSIGVINGLIGRTFPFAVDATFPAGPLASIPVDLVPTPTASLEFGHLSNGSIWNSTGTHKDVPVVLNVASMGGPVGNDQFLLVDATIGSAPRYASFATLQEAQQFVTADLPLWGNRSLGLTAKESLFGKIRPGESPTGLFGALLPIRVSGVAEGKFLFFTVKKHFEVVLDIAATTITDNPSGSITVELGSSYARIGNGSPQIGNGQPLKSVSGSVTIDNVRYEVDAVKFRVADFRINLKTSHFLFPIRLSSGALERGLNNGTIPLTEATKAQIELPKCLFTAYDKFKSPAGVCAQPQLIGWLGHVSGKRATTATLDLSTFAVQVKKYQQGAITWSAIQAAVMLQIR